ncbi:hypothetical protein GCM10010978_16830 [Compostibacillus humi]|uniref:Holin n=1 Tax=Compostibacillus humi TaxID=1245525 RepID=A0A8J2TK13_9BACI|nr:phage holin family protein [Compostibacillus humi]GFZ75887.1 hypothetical protein GCM10010978_16830 [Compostibacillus humi]
MELLSVYIRAEAFILIPALYFICIILEQTPMLPKWTHAWIKLAFSIVSCLLYFGIDITSVVQGILVTGAEMVSRDIIQNILSRNGNKNDRKKDIEEQKE